jgi:hypothetical protein
VARTQAYNVDKRRRFDELLSKGWVTIHFDARKSGVRLPARLLTNPDSILQYGRDMPRPISDLTTTDQGVTATLSFSGAPQPTHVPWPAVFYIGDRQGKGRWYLDEVPPEVKARTEKKGK